MNIAIIDDEKIFLDIIVRKLDLSNHHVYTYTSLSDMEKSNRKFELLLLDIEMPDYDGIRYSKEHRDQRIIFLTGHSQRMKEAFGENVYGFIEKSDSKDMMRKTINAVIADIQNQECITLKINGQIFDFIINDIVYAQYIRYKTIGLVYHNQTYIIHGYTLKEMALKLGNNFVYIDRSTLVNVSKVIHIIDNKVYVKGIKQLFEISVRRKQQLKKYSKNID